MKKVLIKLIKFYQNQISPLLRKHCIFEPSCSQYTIEAIEEYGSIKGSLMGMWRILRCNPLSKGGYDPVKKRQNL